MCHLCPLAFWEYNIPQEHDLTPHVAGASGLNSKAGTHLDRLSSTLDYAAAFARFIRVHGASVSLVSTRAGSLSPRRIDP
jgi:hypothetical protein